MLLCALTRRKLKRRYAEWKDLDDALVSRHVSPGRITAFYARRPGLYDRLEELIRAEATCCPFLGFELGEEGDLIRLAVTVPEGAERLLAPLLPEAEAVALSARDRRASPTSVAGGY